MKLVRRLERTRGQVLIMTAFLIFVLFTLALSFFKLVPLEFNSALRSKQAVSAGVVASSGVKEAKVWLESQPPQKILDQPTIEREFNTGARDAAVLLGETWDESSNSSEKRGDWRYLVVMTKNPYAPFAFDVVSTAYFEDRPVRQVRATLARENFSHYALFIDRWEPSLMMEASSGAIQGPFHTNNFFRLVIPSGFYDGPGDPFVSGPNGVMTHSGVTSHGSLPFVGEWGDGNAYYDTSVPTPNSSEAVVPYGAEGEIESRYDKLVSGGRTNLQTTEHVILPYSSDELLAQALGGTDASAVAVPGDIGLYVPVGAGNKVTGGIFVVGDVKIDLSINSDGDQVHTFTQSIPVEAYRYVTQQTYSEPIYGEVKRTLGVGDTYYRSESVTQTVNVQKIVGYETESQTTTRQVQVGQQYVSGGGGGTTVGSWQPVYETQTQTTEVRVPIYDSVPEQRSTTVRHAVTITDPEDPQIGSVVMSYEVRGYEERVRDVVNVVSKEEYEANPGAFPDATRFFRPGPEKTATVTEVSGPSPKTIVKDYENQTYHYSGSLNGVTFVDGTIASLKGVSKGAQDPRFSDGETFQGRYIAANPALASKGKITIVDDLLQFYNGPDSSLKGAIPNTLKVGKLSPNSQHALGLVSRETHLKPAFSDPLDLYAVIIAGHSVRGTENDQGIPEVAGGFGSDPSVMRSGYGMNEFNLYGGLIQANQMLWNQSGNGLKGNLTYDPAVAGDMPRFPRSNRVTTLRYTDRYAGHTP